MKKRILIITSEHLNPDAILNSTFELTQAEILQEKYEVAIISVFLHTPIQENFIAVAKRIVLLREFSRTVQLSRQLLSSLFYRCKRKRNHTQKWIIEGIQVYEGHGNPLRSVNDHGYSLVNWVDAGLSAYNSYIKENGPPHIIHAHGRFLAAGVLALKLKSLYHHSFFYTEHSSRFPSGYVPAASIPMLNKVIDQCSLYIAVSPQLHKKVEETLDRKIIKAVVIPNAVDSVFTGPLSPPIAAEPFIFSVVANLEHRKGIDILLRAFKKAFHGDPRYLLRLAGEGPEREDLEKLTEYLGLKDCVFFAGKISKPDVLKLLDHTHVFILPSRFETFGVAIIEALARGCPVVSTICGGPEFIVPIECGILIEPENEDQLEEALKKIRTNYSRYNRNSIRLYALQRFGPSVFLASMEKIYSQDDIIIDIVNTEKELQMMSEKPILVPAKP